MGVLWRKTFLKIEPFPEKKSPHHINCMSMNSVKPTLWVLAALLLMRSLIRLLWRWSEKAYSAVLAPLHSFARSFTCFREHLNNASSLQQSHQGKEIHIQNWSRRFHTCSTHSAQLSVTRLLTIPSADGFGFDEPRVVSRDAVFERISSSMSIAIRQVLRS